jgi:hypothetical protein
VGRTAELVSILGRGGAHLGTQTTDQESIRLSPAGIDQGITFLDNCWDNTARTTVRSCLQSSSLRRADAGYRSCCS